MAELDSEANISEFQIRADMARFNRKAVVQYVRAEFWNKYGRLS
jgi:hypothetical protein